MPSHLEDPESKKQRPDWVTELDILGNGVADSLADNAANMGELDLSKTRPVVYYTNLVKRVQARFATIICNLPQRNK